MTPDNYENPDLFPALLDGKIPAGYSMKERTPLNELKNISTSPEVIGPRDTDLNILKAFDGVLMFLPWDIMQDNRLSQKMHEIFMNATKKG